MNWWSNHVKRVVGNGRETRFWLDAWTDEGPLKTRFERLYRLALNKNLDVKEAGEQVEGVWKWNLEWRREMFLWETELWAELQRVINQVELQTDREDAWVWQAENSGRYTVQSAYKVIMHARGFEKDSFYKNLWNALVPLKVSCFSWKASRDRLPTLTNLLRRNIATQSGSMCPGCKREEETVSHIFYVCNLFSPIWMECMKWLGFQTAFHYDCKTHWYQFTGLISGNLKVRQKWQVIWYAVMWGIWLARNRIVFKGENIESAEIVELIKIHSWRWLSAKRTIPNIPMSSWFLNPLSCLRC